MDDDGEHGDAELWIFVTISMIFLWAMMTVSMVKVMMTAVHCCTIFLQDRGCEIYIDLGGYH